MTTKLKVILSLVALLSAYSVGRWSAPEKIVEKIKTVEVIKEVKVKETDKERHKKVTITETTRPDGTVEKTTVITDDRSSSTTSNTNTDSNTTMESSKEVINSSSRVTIMALAGVNPTAVGVPMYGAYIGKPILGPITLGAWALSNPSFGLGLGLTF